MTNSLIRYSTAVAVLAATIGAPAAADGPFVVNAIQAPATLDPAFACDIVDDGYLAPLYAPLVGYGRKSIAGPEGVTVTAENEQDIVPMLAESYSVSDDGLTYSFKLRDGLTFASGNQLDGPAAAASLNRALKSGGCGTYFMEAANFGNTQSIVGEGNAVTIKLARPEPLLIHSLTQPNLSIVDVKVVDEMGGKEWLAVNSAGSGPYMLSSYQPGVRATYVANPNYYGEAPIEPEIIVNYITDPSALLLQARSGAADVTLGLPKQMVDQVKDEMNVVSVPAPRFVIVALPNKVEPFDNVKFRQALSYAVPYDAIRNSVAFGYGQSFFGPYPPEFAAYRSETGEARRFDMNKARELLAESGVTGDVEIEFTIREGFSEHEQIATILQGAWSQLGVKVSISKVSASAYTERVVNAEKSTAIVRSDGPSVADPGWLLNYDLRCQSAFNQSNYCNESAENLLNEALVLADPAARQEKWDAIAKLWVEDTPRIPVYADIYTAVLDKDVTRWDFAQDGPFDLWRWGR